MLARNLTVLSFFAFLLLFSSCSDDKVEVAGTGAVETQEDYEHDEGELADLGDLKGELIATVGGISVYKKPHGAGYPNASLELKAPESPKAGANKFKYSVSGFQLATMTKGGEPHHLANSQKGQHIHSIVDTTPYEAHYTDTFTRSIAEGSHYHLAFLSRSFHESIKTHDAYAFQVLDNSPVTGPLLFYSRPKGEYKGTETKSILLDFYLLNAALSESKNRVVATINGNKFTLTDWVPYIVEGLPMGENTFTLELQDSNENMVKNPLNPVTRTITLSE